MSPKRIGRIGERLAENYLRGQGYSLIEKNYRSSRGEIDLIMSQANELVFIEVKTRQTAYGGSFIFDSITLEQEIKLSQTARRYIAEKMGKKWRGKYRFDAVGIVLVGNKLIDIKILRGFIH